MTDLTYLNLNIPIEADDSQDSGYSPPSLDDRLICAAYYGCFSEYCRIHGCVNALLMLNQGKGVMS